MHLAAMVARKCGYGNEKAACLVTNQVRIWMFPMWSDVPR
jgi:hypothetical protein